MHKVEIRWETCREIEAHQLLMAMGVTGLFNEERKKSEQRQASPVPKNTCTAFILCDGSKMLERSNPFVVNACSSGISVYRQSSLPSGNW